MELLLIPAALLLLAFLTACVVIGGRLVARWMLDDEQR